jgi:hypothetical protein
LPPIFSQWRLDRGPGDAVHRCEHKCPAAAGQALEQRYLLGSRVCRSAQYNVAAKMPKAAAISAATIISVGIDVLPSFREHDAGKSDGDFDPDQI